MRKTCSFHRLMTKTQYLSHLSDEIWDTKYRFREGNTVIDASIEDTWRRVARALASVAQDRNEYWAACFYGPLKDFCFIPGGRILAGAGTSKRATLFNCFVMGPIPDSREGIVLALHEGVLTMQQGGGVGYDFSTLRPREIPANSLGITAFGLVSCMRIWDKSCSTIVASNARRGAMMATLRCDHPDIEEFIDAKRDPTALRHFNLSVQVTDTFMVAVRSDSEWLLIFPIGTQVVNGDEVVERCWTGAAHPVPCRVVRRVRARMLWRKMMRATYDSAEPGVLFIDSINRWNNLWYCEQISFCRSGSTPR